MLLILHNHYTEFTPNTDADRKALGELHTYMCYNDHHEIYKQATGKAFDEDDEDALEYARMSTRSQRFSNWCAYTLTGEMNNGGNPFRVDEMHDGWKAIGRLFEDRNHVVKGYRIAAGHTRGAITFLQELGCELHAQDKRVNLVEFKRHPPKQVGGMTAREDQERLLIEVLDTIHDTEQAGGMFHTSMLDLAVNTGKTFIIGAFVRCMENPAVGLPFRERYLAARAVADYMEMGFQVGCMIADKAEVKRELKLRGIAGEPDWTGRTGEIVVMMVQTVMAWKERTPAEVYLRIKAFIFDECDSFAGEQAQEFLRLFTPGFVMGMSGTAMTKPMPSHWAVMRGMFGGKRYRITTADNVEKGISMRPEVRVHLVKHKGGNRTIGWAKVDVLQSQERLDKLEELLEEHAGKPLVISFGELEIKHGAWLAEKVKEMGHDPVLVHGDTPDRQGIFERFNAGEIPVMIANRVVRRGVNIAAMRVWVQWDPTNNETSIIQGAIGRGTRTDGVHDSFRIEDFMDTGYILIERDAVTRIKYYRDPQHGATVELLYPHDGQGYHVEAVAVPRLGRG